MCDLPAIRRVEGDAGESNHPPDLRPLFQPLGHPCPHEDVLFLPPIISALRAVLLESECRGNTEKLDLPRPGGYDGHTERGVSSHGTRRLGNGGELTREVEMGNQARMFVLLGCGKRAGKLVLLKFSPGPGRNQPNRQRIQSPC